MKILKKNTCISDIDKYAKELIDKDLIKKQDNKYVLTSLGKEVYNTLLGVHADSSRKKDYL